MDNPSKNDFTTRDVDFEKYYKKAKVLEWSDKYFPYQKVKNEIFREYHHMITNISHENKGTESNDVTEIKFINFGNNKHFDHFLEQVEIKIIENFSQVRFFN